MLLRKINIESSSLSEFLKNLDDHISQKKFKERFSDFIKLGMEFLLEFPSVNNIYYYNLNENNFIFDYFSAYPKENRILSDELFQTLIDNNVIGRSLESESCIKVDKDNKDYFNNLLVVPVLKRNAVIGLFILILDDEQFIFNNDLIDKINLFSRYFSSFLENELIKRELEQTKALLEQRVAERTMNIAHSKRELQAILNSVNTGIIVVDPITNEVIQANITACQLLSKDLDKVIGLNLTDLLETKASDEDNNIAFSINFESKLLIASKSSDIASTVPILRSTSFIKLGNQRMRIESFVDISERKKIEQALKRSNELLEQKVQDRTEDLQILVHKLKNEVEERKKAEAEVRKMLQKEMELNELKSKFVSLVSHEFRTPLTIINSAAQIIEKYREKISIQDQNQYLNRIMKTVDEMATLLENVIFIGKSEVYKLSYNPQPINVVEIVKSVIQDLLMSIEIERKIDFNFDLYDEYAIIDEKLLRHILLNLFTNAIKYSSDESAIIFNIHSDESNIKFIIQDFGIGIPEAEITHIFEQFYRADNVGNISGTGLGMSVIAKSLEMMKGSIEVESEINKGTIFTITIPNNTRK